MKVKVNLIKNAYLTNCTVINIIKRVRKRKNGGDFDYVEVECNNWHDIRQVFFNGNILIPEEIEENEIVMWKHEKIDNNKNDITLDIEEIRKLFNKSIDNIATYEIEEILKDLQESFEIKVNKLKIK